MKETQENHLGKEDSQTTGKKAIHILILTDKLQDMPFLLRCLCHLPGYIVASKHVVNLPQALYQLRNERFDIIFLDEGFNSDATAKEVLETFQECKIDVPVIVIRGEDNEPAAPQLLKAGAYGFIPRNDPETQVFIETIQKALSRSAVPDEQRD
jgi:DNA-binding NtrC family response regulator